MNTHCPGIEVQDSLAPFTKIGVTGHYDLKTPMETKPMTNITDIIETLAEAKSAIERLPQAEAECRELHQTVGTLTESKHSLESALEASNAKIAALTETIRALEVARDEAGFRELETQEKLENLLRTLRGVTGDLDSAMKDAEPKPEPEAKVESVPEAQPDPEIGSTIHQGASSPFPEPIGVGLSDASTAAVPPTEPDLPYTNQPSWMKPDSMSWDDWSAQGGLKPYWMA